MPDRRPGVEKVSDRIPYRMSEYMSDRLSVDAYHSKKEMSDVGLPGLKFCSVSLDTEEGTTTYCYGYRQQGEAPQSAQASSPNELCVNFLRFRQPGASPCNWVDCYPHSIPFVYVYI